VQDILREIPRVIATAPHTISSSLAENIIWGEDDAVNYVHRVSGQPTVRPTFLHGLYQFLIPLTQNRAELQAKLFVREGEEYLPLFEPNNPVAFLHMRLEPSGKRKEPKPVGISYNGIEPSRGSVGEETIAVAKCSTMKTASRAVVIFQLGSEMKV